MIPKLSIRDRQVCHITLEEVICEDLNNNASDEYISILKTMTNIGIQNSTEGSYVVDCDLDTLDETLSNLRHFGYKVAVVWAEGSWPDDSDIDKEILKSVEEWDKEEWGCAGHILDRPGRQNPIFHHQCVIINLQKLTKILYCKIREYEASSEYLHDNYTPKWIQPASENYIPNSSWQETEGEKPYNLFNHILRSSLDAGLKVFNLDYNIRNCKACIYPEDDIQWTEGEIDKKFNNMQPIYDMMQTYPDKKPLFEFKVQDQTNLYILNTESVPDTTVDDIQVMVCPCSGLHQFKYIQSSIDTMELILWTDFSPYAVKWLEILIREWDGKNFHDFFKANEHRLEYTGSIIYGHGTWEKFIDSFESEQEWLTLWSKIQNLEHQFKVVNIVEDYKTIVNMLPHNKNVLLQCSNIFLYEANYFSKKLNTVLNSILYINDVQNISNKVYFHGNLNGNYYDMTNMNRRKWI